MIWVVFWENEACGIMTCGMNNMEMEWCLFSTLIVSWLVLWAQSTTEDYIRANQPWYDPLWLTGLKAPLTKLFRYCLYPRTTWTGTKLICPVLSSSFCPFDCTVPNDHQKILVLCTYPDAQKQIHALFTWTKTDSLANLRTKTDHVNKNRQAN